MQRVLQSAIIVAVLIIGGAYIRGHLYRTPAPPAPAPITQAPEEHVEGSPVGTSSPIVQKTFSVTHVVQFPFSIPAHAATPRLHGNFRAYVQQEVGPYDGKPAIIDLMVLNDEQYAVLSSGRDPEVLFASEPSDAQDVSFNLSPSLAQPVKYHLVFRNANGGAPKKVVKADFTVDF